MRSDIPPASVQTGGYPIFRILASFPIACFSGALVTDIVYASTADMIWADFSAWLLAAGMVFAVLAGVAGLIDLVANRRLWTLRQIAPLLMGSLLVFVLGFFDNLVHSRDAWTSVVPFGLVLSAVTVIVMLATVWASSAPHIMNAPYRGSRP